MRMRVIEADVRSSGDPVGHKGRVLLHSKLSNSAYLQNSLIMEIDH